MNILVTGGGGFLGRYIVKALLDRNYNVRIFGRQPQPDLEKQGVDVFIGDLSDPVAVNNAIFDRDAVFHVAAKAGIWGPWESFYTPNVIGTKNVLKACKTHGIQYLVHTSTPSVVFNGEHLRNADESLPYSKSTLSHYAKTKAIAEEMVLAANNSTSFRTTALRPHLIWGIGDNHLIPRILERAKNGQLRIVGSGDNYVDITHVKNAAHAHLLALDALQNGRACGKPYFLSQGTPVQLWPWINSLLSRLGIPTITKTLSFNKAYFAATFLEYFHKILLPQIRPLSKLSLLSSGCVKNFIRVLMYSFVHCGPSKIFSLPEKQNTEFRKRSNEPRLTRFLVTELAKDHYFSIKNAQKDLNYQPIISTEQGLNELIRLLA